jgi:hypothetical protein
MALQSLFGTLSHETGLYLAHCAIVNKFLKYFIYRKTGNGKASIRFHVRRYVFCAAPIPEKCNLYG